jgi:hypothetical protein
VKQEVALKDKKRKLRTQKNGKLNDLSSAGKNKKMSLQSPHLKTIKRQYIYPSIEDSEVVLVFESNNVGLKKLSEVLSQQTSDSSAFLNVTMCLLRYV